VFIVPLRFRSRLLSSFARGSSLARGRAPRFAPALASSSAALRRRFASASSTRVPLLGTHAPSALLGLSLAASLLVPLRALADATVVVELKRPDGSAAEGGVQLTKGEAKYGCSTDKAGRCELRGVAGGVYTVKVDQPGRPAPKEKTVVIPPSGEVKLIVNAS
jgi:hypothetical protein